MNRSLYGYPSRVLDNVPTEPIFYDAPTWRAPLAQTNNNAGPLVSGTVYAHFFKVFRPLVCDGMAYRFPTNPSASVDTYLGIYEDDTFAPAHLVVSTKMTAITTGGVKSSLVPSTYLYPGIWWAAFLCIHSTNGTVAPEQTAQFSNAQSSQWWGVNPYGTGNVPTITSGSDGIAWEQASQTELPLKFGGTPRANSTGIVGDVWVDLRVRPAG